MAPHKSSSCLWLFPFPPYDNFKKPLPLCFSRSHKYNNYDKATYIVSSNLCLFTCSQATGFPWNPYPQRHISAKRVFLKFIPLFLVLTFQIIYRYPRSESAYRKLNITQFWRSLDYQNLQEKNFYNFIVWSTRLNVKVKI